MDTLLFKFMLYDDNVIYRAIGRSDVSRLARDGKCPTNLVYIAYTISLSDRNISISTRTRYFSHNNYAILDIGTIMST